MLYEISYTRETDGEDTSFETIFEAPAFRVAHGDIRLPGTLLRYAAEYGHGNGATAFTVAQYAPKSVKRNGDRTYAITVGLTEYPIPCVP